tara:strand:- start:151 stop:405 length:255 start_codon:yes stop_codon:yes gene_type:complete
LISGLEFTKEKFNPKNISWCSCCCFSTLTIQLIPLSKQASRWNRCVTKTTETLSQVKAVEKMNEESKEVLSVMICNGAVFEPKF